MTENLSIAPNFRSNKGDFSDVEVDVMLSSQLLNNRLLLNGNFGYRDNTYRTSNTNFIGDFDIEYLLNNKGTFRLKAYKITICAMLSRLRAWVLCGSMTLTSSSARTRSRLLWPRPRITFQGEPHPLQTVAKPTCASLCPW